MAYVKLGIIGVGNMGTTHIENLLAGKVPELKLTAAADRRASRREWVAQAVPGIQVFSEGSELIRSGVCDAEIGRAHV